MFRFLDKPWFCILFAFSLAFISFKLIKPSTRRHAPSKIFQDIHGKKTYKVDWKHTYDSVEVSKLYDIIKQPFFYYGKGKQCYVFLSQDGEYVVKFIMHKRLAPRELTILEKLAMKNPKLEKKKRQQELFNSFIISYEDIPLATGTEAVYLKQQEIAMGIFTLVDERGNVCKVNAKDVEFILQKRARLVKPEIIRLMYEKNVDAAKRRIDQVFQLLVDCAKDGVQDTDSGLVRNNNIGFLEDRAIYIDTGKLVRSKKMTKKPNFEKDLKRLKPLQNWLKAYYPELAEYYDERKEVVLKSF